MNGPTYGQQRVTMTARIAARATCRRTKVKTPRAAHPIEMEAAMITVADKTTRIRVLNDAYALDMDGGSEDPADPSKTTRVLTIMRADEC
jgi:hypothetical protein